MDGSASSSSSSSTGARCEVLLNICGQDTRTSFADHLYHALLDAGIQAFMRENEEMPPELITAIEQSIIFVPIFSQNYASSESSLIELTKIVDCSDASDQVILPIFYNIEPSAVRNQTGSFAKSFEQHHNSFDHTTVQKWKKALKQVGSLKGWDSRKTADGHERMLIKLVVATIWSTLNETPSIVSQKLVGMQPHVEKMLELLSIESEDIRIVGISGFGGIGKTTIAKAVYNEISYAFEGCSFLANVREISQQQDGLTRLQNQLCLDFLKQENPNITMVDDGPNLISEIFHNKKVLIVIDDADQVTQIDAIVGDREWFGIGSRILVITRNQALLMARRADAIYEPKEMDSSESLQLFSNHAFRRDEPPTEYLELSKAIVKSTGGLPLTLRVVGSSLFSMPKSAWEGTFEKLREVPNNEVMERLKTSYDKLGYGEKQMFLDVACLFNGMHKDVACYIWEACDFHPTKGLDVLLLTSLITIDEDGYLTMHDQLRDLGRAIVRQENISEPWERTRIWSHEEALDVLTVKTGKRNVEALSVDFGSRSRRQCLENEGFAEMNRLRLLRVDYACFAGNFKHSFSELRWLSWHGCPMRFTLPNFDPKKLVVLDLSDSDITEHWKGWKRIKVAANLKFLNLCSCKQLWRTPDLSGNRRLEMLLFKGCEGLVHIDVSVGLLENLKDLDFSGCRDINSFPIKFSSLTSLEKLSFKTCEDLEEIPSDIEKLVKLTTLKFFSSDFSILPAATISNLTCLEELTFIGCTKLQCISILPSGLTSLTIISCFRLTQISGVSGLESLESLTVVGCLYLERLPDLSSLRKLERLHVVLCNRLTEIGGLDKLESLEELIVVQCARLEISPDQLSNLKNLKKSAVEKFTEILNLESRLGEWLAENEEADEVRRPSSCPKIFFLIFILYCCGMIYEFATVKAQHLFPALIAGVLMWNVFKLLTRRWIG